MDPVFAGKVNEQVERLQATPWGEIELAVAEKRRGWVRRHAGQLPARPVSPRQAYELLFFTYMGLRPEDLPVVAESETEIVWRSLNPCPTLEACLRLGLDTRQVCRQAYEQSTQAFLAEVDPQLRFSRSYTEIRPYAEYCLERITREG
ncbi:MAG: hypothetical protein GYA17_02555 [Chloroflexi bacterium]|jgi:hypothetical protein|nr:hypothetical protein [Anaerolineaceae bacterium]NMB87211.1 hypothetical protein [Chloroflexota bacterium]